MKFTLWGVQSTPWPSATQTYGRGPWPYVLRTTSDERFLQKWLLILSVGLNDWTRPMIWPLEFSLWHILLLKNTFQLVGFQFGGSDWHFFLTQNGHVPSTQTYGRGGLDHMFWGAHLCWHKRHFGINGFTLIALSVWKWTLCKKKLARAPAKPVDTHLKRHIGIKNDTM